MSKQYFDVDKLLEEKPDARYYFLLSGRGKVYGVLRRSLKDYSSGLGLFAYVRRYDKEIKTKNVQELFSPQKIDEITDGKYNKIAFWRGFFYLEKWEFDEEKGEVRRSYRNPDPCGVALALNTWERDKGKYISVDGFKHIIFDEVITGMNYLTNEFQTFQQVISSLVRDRYEKDTKIWFLANAAVDPGLLIYKILGSRKKK